MEFHAFVVADDAVRVGGITVPERPPTAVVLGERFVGERVGEEVTVIDAGS